VDAARLDGIQRFPGGAIVVADGAHGPERFLVRGGTVRPLQSKVSALGEALHAGTWAGAWSGALNVVSALLLCVMMTTGIRSWWTRRRRAA
jgi:sulfite reductase (NADPH) flavoprotein alpha-component